MGIDLLAAARIVHVNSSCAFIAAVKPIDGCEDCLGRHVVRGIDLLEQPDSQPKLPHSGVPMLIHQTWSSMELKEPQLGWSASWFRCLPHWKHVVWTDDDILELFRLHHPALLDVLASYPYKIMWGDVIRYLALSEFGGTTPAQ